MRSYDGETRPAKTRSGTDTVREETTALLARTSPDDKDPLRANPWAAAREMGPTRVHADASYSLRSAHFWRPKRRL